MSVGCALRADESDETCVVNVIEGGRSPLMVALALACCLAAIVLRKPDAFSNPQFWAEDGDIFFRAAYETGFGSLLTPYAGYYHLYPRAAALLAVSFSPVITPTVFNAFAIVGMLAPAVLMLSSRIDLPNKGLLAVLLYMAPSSPEVFMTLTNTQWFLALGIPLLAIMNPPKSLRSACGDYLLLLVLGLTGPFIVPFTLLFIIRLVVTRDRHSLQLLVVATCCCAVQSLDVGGIVYEGGGGTATLWDFTYVEAMSFFWGSAILSLDSRLFQSDVLDIILAAAFMGTYSFLLVHFSLSRDWRKIIVLLAGALILASSFAKFTSDPRALLEGFNRYYAIPSILLSVSIALMSTQWKLLGPLLAVVVSLNFSLRHEEFRRPPYVDFEWQERIEACLNEPQVVECKIPINPPGFSFVFRPQ